MHRRHQLLLTGALLLALLPSAARAAGPEREGEPPALGDPEAQPDANEERAILDRIRWLREGRVDPSGHFPVNARIRAYEEIEENQRKGLLEPDLIPGSKWVALGPSPSSGNSGRVASIAVDPTSSSTVYVGSASGGVWKSTDEGATWAALTDQQASLSIGSIAVAPSAPATIYAGTGEPNNSCDSYFGAGVLRSTDSGSSWALVGNSTFASHSISRVVVHPTTPSTLWISVTDGASLSFLCSGVGASNMGIWKSTDSGGTWVRGTNATGSADRVALDPANPLNLYGAFSGSGIRKSVDGGANWTQLAGGLPTTSIGRADVAVRATDGNVFAIFENSSGSGLLGIYRSTDAGGTWASIGTPASSSLCSTYCWYFIGIEASPDGSIWARGFDDYRTTNNGTSWSLVTSGVHVDNHAIAFSPNGNAWVGSDGGAYLCVKSATNCVSSFSWTNRNTGLGIMQFYPGASLHPTNANWLMAGAQDNGTNRLNGATWGQVYGGDGAWTAIDPGTPTTVFASYQYLVIVKSTNSGGSFGSATSGLTDSNTSNAPFIATFEVCPNNGSILIAGSDNVWKTTNGATSWSSNSPDPLVSGSRINAMAFSKADATCNTYFVGTTGGKVWRTSVGGGTSAANWTNVTGTIPARGIQDFAVSPTDGNVVYVGLSGYSANVWKSTNALAATPTWASVSTGLPNVPVNAVVIDPSNTSYVYAGTDTGVFRSTNGGTSWASYSTGLPKVPVFDLQANGTTSTVVAFTHGRGAWRLATQPAGEAGASTALKVRKNGANYDFTWGGGNGCEAADSGLYRGSLTTLLTSYNHNTALNCALASPSVSIAQSDGRFGADDYFLVAASNGVEEGSYGKSSSGTEIPVSTAKCRAAQNVATCP